MTFVRILTPMLGLAACGGLGLTPLDGEDALDSGLSASIEPVAVPLTGRTYDVSLHQIEVVEPAGLGPLIQASAEGTLLFHVLDEDLDRLSLVMSMGDIRGQQVECAVIYDLPEADWSTNPAFSVEGGQTVIDVAGKPLTLRELSIETTVANDASAWTGLRLRTVIDTRELIGGSVPEGTDVCELVENLGGECMACDDDAMACAMLELRFDADESDLAFDADADDC